MGLRQLGEVGDVDVDDFTQRRGDARLCNRDELVRSELRDSVCLPDAALMRENPFAWERVEHDRLRARRSSRSVAHHPGGDALVQGSGGQPEVLPQRERWGRLEQQWRTSHKTLNITKMPNITRI